NPLSVVFTKPRLCPPSLEAVNERLKSIDLSGGSQGAGGVGSESASDSGCVTQEDLLVFFHPETLQQIYALRDYLLRRQEQGALEPLDEWIRMVAINRLTGHAPGFFSVYTMPPNQAVSVKSQRKINERRGQTPQPRDVARLILKKSRQLLADCDGPSR